MDGKTLAAKWHEVALSSDPAAVGAMLHDDAVFESPVVHTPQRGKAMTTAYLTSAGNVLGNDSFEYVGEWYAENSCVLEFRLELDGIAINGVDMITCNDDGQITHFKVMVRPLKAINLVHQKMGEMLEKMKRG
ncbi:nuclear transport factor 2 family protein [Sphingorhabdus sp.]|jgi:hypothetical protein|uniref:nuclear transport factor 2 family protein n=1 Tax=Sphingorhabdus sp. TaxID=1902408 RepID=UPI0035B20197|nr:nuclear transport factor 2 family protein [Sphingomonadaceae bacterium]